MSDLLATHAPALTDHELHRVLRAVSLAGDVSFMAAFDIYTAGLAKAGSGATVRRTLEAAGVQQLDAIAQDVRTLSAADEARATINRRVVELHELDAGGSTTDVPGRDVPVGRPGQPPRVDAQTYAEIMGSHPVHWARLHAARRLPGGEHFAGSAGQDRFGAQDREMAEGGFDLVGGLRQAASAQAAQQQAAAAGRKLDQALRQGRTPGERRVLLDAAVSQGLRELDASVAEPPAPTSGARATVKLLDAAHARGDSEAVTALSRQLNSEIAEGNY